MEIVPYNVDPHDDSIWQDQFIPGLKPVQKDLEMISGRPFTPVAFDLYNSYHGDIQQDGNTPIAALILRVKAMIPRASGTSTSASSSSTPPA